MNECELCIGKVYWFEGVGFPLKCVEVDERFDRYVFEHSVYFGSAAVMRTTLNKKQIVNNVL
ncbi:hypothetical protein [Myroides odoratimimus]|uniref:hypothetical protein n=1 Tax=Myroides odoratimimus TaxID=76832 RepID=UPI002DBF3687|nr:hypothetical protein [Myroides odoratimimus]MEC4083546.1 hypothetical protein [Myroides odoratimimus]